VLREEIAEGLKPGDRLAAERHLARRFKVNPRTMREALRLLVEEGRIVRRQPQGTVVAKPRTDRWVAIVMDHDIGHPHISFFLRRALQDLRLYLQSAGVKARPYLGFRQFGTEEEVCTCEEFEDDLAARRLSGVVFLSGSMPKRVFQALTEQGVPFVGSNAAEACGVTTDLIGRVRQGFQYLAAHGRRHVALISWNDGKINDAYRQEAARLDIEVRDAWVRGSLHPTLPGAGWEELREVWSTRDKPDGLVVTDDVLFQDVVTALRDMRIRVPEQLMVVAHTNRGSDLRAPFPVAWLEIDPAEYARLAGELLLKQLHGIPIETRQLELSSRLIVPEEDRTEQEGKALGWSPPVSDNENSVVPSL
jgi:hypothetical protein